MRRREFITLIGGAAAALPFAARAQEAIPLVGFLRSTRREAFEHLTENMRDGLKESGTSPSNITGQTTDATAC